jgi:predicted 2-oxoglutarate/Fe(II)-dependent dioxygenase YbiX/peroxiredoxin
MPRLLEPGDPAPLFVVPTPQRPDFRFDTVAGRYIVLSFFGSTEDAQSKRLLSAIAAEIGPFNDAHATFFGVTRDQNDAQEGRLPLRVPGLRHFFDFDSKISTTYGADQRKFSYVLSPNLRVLARFPIEDGAEHARLLTEFVSKLPPLTRLGTATPGAPVLVVPYLFEPEFCRALIDYYNKTGGEESGFMQTLPDGRTAAAVDHAHKKRKDATIEDEPLRLGMKARIERRLVPEIKKAFQFNATRIERYIVACYDSGEGGYFRAHRDNTTKGTAHRRFAVTINLNAEEFEGGELRFPEYDRHSYKAPTGGAVVFSCSLLHEALPVTKGTRYCTLPFLYDEEGAKIREQNLSYFADDGLRSQLERNLLGNKEKAAS